MQSSAYLTNQIPESLTILKRIVEADESAVENCIDTYANLIWAMAREHIDSLEEAEIITREIFSTSGNTPDVAVRPNLMNLLLSLSLRVGD